VSTSRSDPRRDEVTDDEPPPLTDDDEPEVGVEAPLRLSLEEATEDISLLLCPSRKNTNK